MSSTNFTPNYDNDTRNAEAVRFDLAWSQKTGFYASRSAGFHGHPGHDDVDHHDRH